MPLRPATAADAPTVHALIRALAEYEQLAHECRITLDQLHEHVFASGSHVSVTLAVDDDGTTVGMALWWRTYSTFLGVPGIWLEDLFVLPAHRGRGFGLALLSHLRASTGGRVEWYVLDWNTPSIRFYDALGATPVRGWTTYRWLPGTAAGAPDTAGGALNG